MFRAGNKENLYTQIHDNEWDRANAWPDYAIWTFIKQYFFRHIILNLR